MFAAGYREYAASPYDRGVKRLLQKSYKDSIGEKYFINCREWDWREFRGNIDRDFTYEFDVQFTDSLNRTFNAELVGWNFEPDKWGNPIYTLKDVEEFFEKLWQSMECQYYEKYTS